MLRCTNNHHFSLGHIVVNVVACFYFLGFGSSALADHKHVIFFPRLGPAYFFFGRWPFLVVI